MVSYIDGFILAVPKANLEKYKKLAAVAGEVWMAHGALSYIEAVADDVPYGDLTSFPRAVQAAEDETVVFSWITYPSRAVRDEVNKKAMADERLNDEGWRDLFDGKRMIYGGFAIFLEQDRAKA